MQDSFSRKRRKNHAPGAPLASLLRRPEVLAVICAKRGSLQQAKGRANAWAATPDPRQAAVLLTARRAVQVTFAQPELRWMSLAKKWSKLRGKLQLDGITEDNFLSAKADIIQAIKQNFYDKHGVWLSDGDIQLTGSTN